MLPKTGRHRSYLYDWLPLQTNPVLAAGRILVKAGSDGSPASAIGALPARLSARFKNAVQGCLMFKSAQKVAIFRIVRVSLDRRHDDLPVIDRNSGAKRKGAVGLAHSNTYKQNA